jgi:hypothetical protein
MPLSLNREGKIPVMNAPMDKTAQDAWVDKDTQHAWNGWVAFTRFATWSVVAAVAALGLMALTLL